jgi:hypothetical protein
VIARLKHSACGLAPEPAAPQLKQLVLHKICLFPSLMLLYTVAFDMVHFPASAMVSKASKASKGRSVMRKASGRQMI